ncbi:hypothetical protein Kfla_0755 [Kribbella flavida DSM 17836]|uniref:Uncharacterized protein n=1 Tax=Kribbella flavida (strain DSM 17836 / JCM 10339 / NBRC 14399) TaxID=479435 RepID=D2PYM8_KRIFD|nr:hypothetical protein [Kribbella flavida]ADB29874.1 hypothetical protein Kfla_0755 [Kribbella flavida DSM 17836]
MTAEPLLLPVGHDLGALQPDAAAARRRQQLRVGVELIELADQDFAVWLLAHGVDSDDRPTRTSVTASAAALGLDAEQVDAAVQRFVGVGLLVEVDPAGESAVVFAQEHRLVPLMHGLGPDPEQPWMQTIGLLNQPVVQVSTALYDVWAWSQLAPQLWTGCHDAAIVAEKAGVTDPAETDPRQVLTGVLRNVHALLCVRAAYLDRRVAR